MTAHDPRAMTGEELAAIRDRKEHTPVTLLDERFKLLAHIAALEGQVTEARAENERLKAIIGPLHRVDLRQRRVDPDKHAVMPCETCQLLGRAPREGA